MVYGFYSKLRAKVKKIELEIEERNQVGSFGETRFGEQSSVHNKNNSGFFGPRKFQSGN